MARRYVKTWTRKCAICGKEFTTEVPNQKYCSLKCREVRNRKQDYEANRKSIRKSAKETKRRTRREIRMATMEELLNSCVKVSTRVVNDTRIENRGRCGGRSVQSISDFLSQAK